MGLYANGLLPEIIAQFSSRYPGIEIRLDTQTQHRIAEWVSSGRSDIGVASLPLTNSAIPSRDLLIRPAMCVFAADHKFASREEIHATDLAGEPFISFPRGTPFRFEVDTIFDREGVDRTMMIEATTHEAVCNLVAAGLGVSVVSPYSPHLRRNPALVFRPFTPAIPIALGLVGDPDEMSVAARQFHDFLIEYVEGMKARRKAADARRKSKNNPPNF